MTKSRIRKYKVGDVVKIVANRSDHKFKIGDVVRIRSVDYFKGLVQEAETLDGSDYWCLDETEIEPIFPEQAEEAPKCEYTVEHSFLMEAFKEASAGTKRRLLEKFPGIYEPDTEPFEFKDTKFSCDENIDSENKPLFVGWAMAPSPKLMSRCLMVATGWKLEITYTRRQGNPVLAFYKGAPGVDYPISINGEVHEAPAAKRK